MGDGSFVRNDVIAGVDVEEDDERRVESPSFKAESVNPCSGMKGKDALSMASLCNVGLPISSTICLRCALRLT